MPAPKPVWGADVPISMPLPPAAGEDIQVEFFGFGMTQYRLVHSITEREYQDLSVPVWAPADSSGFASVADDAAIDAAGAPEGTP